MSQLKRLITVLSSLFKKKKVVLEVVPVRKPNGLFTGHSDTHLIFYTDIIHDEDSGVELTIQYICACGNPVYRITDDFGFGCEHCDSVCGLDTPETPCERCRELFSVDFEEG